MAHTHTYGGHGLMRFCFTVLGEGELSQASYFRPTTHLHVYRDILNETLSSQSVLAAWGRMGAEVLGARRQSPVEGGI